jgi:predicted amidohydrolase YtcJ
MVRRPAKKPSKTGKRIGVRGAGRVRPSAGADLIFHSGKVYPVDRRRSWAEAVAVKDGRIVRVGSDRAIRKLRDSDTKLVDLGGRMMMPGLVDVHNHHTRGGQLVRARAGSIEPGKSADLIVLDRNLFECAPDDLADTRVLETWFEGRKVYERAPGS